MEGVSVRKNIAAPQSNTQQKIQQKSNVSTSFFLGDSVEEFGTKIDEITSQPFTDEDRETFIYFGVMSFGITVGIYFLAKVVMSFYNYVSGQDVANEAEKTKAKNCLLGLQLTAYLDLELKSKNKELIDDGKQVIEINFYANNTDYRATLTQDFYEGQLHVSCRIGDKEATWSPMPLTLKQLLSSLDPDFNIFNQFKAHYFKTAFSLGLLTEGTPATRLCKNMTLEDVKNQARSLTVMSSSSSSLSEEEQQKAVFSRDVVHIPGNKKFAPDAQINSDLLGTEGSVIRLGGEDDNPYIKPGNQASLLQQTTVLVRKGDVDTIVRPCVLSLAVPTLDDVDKMPVPSSTIASCTNLSIFEKIITVRPEMKQYLDLTKAPPELKIRNYKLACDTLGKQVVDAAKESNARRVALSAYGMNSSIKALSYCDQRYSPTTNHQTILEETAQKIAVKSFIATVLELRRQGKEVGFYDPCQNSGDFLEKVNVKLVTSRESQLISLDKKNSFLDFDANQVVTYKDNRIQTGDFEIIDNRNSIQDDMSTMDFSADWSWIDDADLIVISGNPDSLVGNALLQDDTYEAQLGCISTMNFVHAWESYRRNTQAN